MTATITSKPAPEALETLNGKVMWRTGNTIVVRTDEGETKQFTVDANRIFMVDGAEVRIDELREGTHLSATRIREDPATVITPETPITGVSRSN